MNRIMRSVLLVLSLVNAVNGFSIIKGSPLASNKQSTGYQQQRDVAFSTKLFSTVSQGGGKKKVKKKKSLKKVKKSGGDGGPPAPPPPAATSFGGGGDSRPRRSRVSDPSGPTIHREPEEWETVYPEDIEEFHYNESDVPNAHQPWRRGEMDGCDDPIDASWRRRAEELIFYGAKTVNATVVDVTWYLCHVVITIENDWSHIHYNLMQQNAYTVNTRGPTPRLFRFPQNPYPEDMNADEDENTIVWERDWEKEKHRKTLTYVPYERGEPLDPEIEAFKEFNSSQPDKETRMDQLLPNYRSYRQRRIDEGMRVENATIFSNPMAVSAIATGIISALETEDEELRILDRHEVLMASRAPYGILDTQKQFDASRGKRVIVETIDPWESNRVLRGVLMDRNTMDVYINVKGRMVTIPNNFVKCVRFPLPEDGFDEVDEYTVTSEGEEDEGEPEDEYEEESEDFE